MIAWPDPIFLLEEKEATNLSRDTCKFNRLSEDDFLSILASGKSPIWFTIHSNRSGKSLSNNHSDAVVPSGLVMPKLWITVNAFNRLIGVTPNYWNYRWFKMGSGILPVNLTVPEIR